MLNLIGELLRELPKGNRWTSNSDAKEVDTKAKNQCVARSSIAVEEHKIKAERSDNIKRLIPTRRKLAQKQMLARTGELLRELPTRQGARTDKTSVGTPTKVQAEREAGIDHHTSVDLQTLAANPDVVQTVIYKAEALRLLREPK